MRLTSGLCSIFCLYLLPTVEAQATPPAPDRAVRIYQGVESQGTSEAVVISEIGSDLDGKKYHSSPGITSDVLVPLQPSEYRQTSPISFLNFSISAICIHSGLSPPVTFT
jgi:hypothetical protein